MAPPGAVLASHEACVPDRCGIGSVLLSWLVACCDGNPMVTGVVHSTLVVLLYVSHVVGTQSDATETTNTRGRLFLARLNAYVAVHSHLPGNGV